MSTENTLYMEIVDTDSDDADYSPHSLFSDSDIFTEELDSSGTETDEDPSDVPPLSTSDNDIDNDNNSNDDEEMSSEPTESNSGSPVPPDQPPPELPVSVPLENVLPLPMSEASAVKSEAVATSIKLASPKRDFLSQSADDDGTICTICFEPWTNSSEHRLVSLKCGHLFGQSCITRWLKSTHKSKCPQCNSTARKADIRPIYARTLKVVDTSERDRALQQLEKETELKGKLQIEFTQMKLKYQMAKQECERLKNELFETKMLLRESRSTQLPSAKSSQPPAKPRFQYVLMKHVELCKQGGCRVIDSCDMLGMLVISQPSTNNLFKGFGLKKISSIELRTSEFVYVHQKPIKDVSFHSHDGLILSASLDKTVKLTSVLTNSVVQSYSLDNDVWSCTWNRDDPRRFFAGVRNGGVFEFDMRMTGGHVSQLPSMGQTSPVVALQYLSKLHTQGHSKSGPIVGHLSGCCFYEVGSDSTYKVHPLPLEGNFTSLSCDQETGHVLASCRPSIKHPQVTHTLCSLSFDENSPVPCSCDRIQTMYGGNTQVQLAKSKLFPHPDDTNSVLVCSGDEDAQGALLWNGSSGQCTQVLKVDSPVLDLTTLHINHKPMLATLTEKNLWFYSWTKS